MRNARKLLSLTAIAVSAVGVSAVPAGAATTTAQFAKRADAICRPLTAKLMALPEPKQASDFAKFLDESLAVGRPGVKRLRALELPTDKRTEARRAVSDVGREVSVLASTAKALKGGADPVATLKRFVKRLDSIEKTEDRAWRAVGATDCAK